MKGKLLTLVIALSLFQLGRWAFGNADTNTLAERGFWAVTALSFIGYTLYFLSLILALSVVFRKPLRRWITKWSAPPPARSFLQASHSSRLPNISLDQRSRLQKFADQLDRDLSEI